MKPLVLDLTDEERSILDWALRRIAHGRGIKLADMRIASAILDKIADASA